MFGFVNYLRVTKAVCLVAVIGAVPLSAAANTTAQDLARIEARGLLGVSDEKLNMLSEPPSAATVAASSAQSITFTKAWLEKQPKAKGAADFQCLAEALYFEARGETVKAGGGGDEPDEGGVSGGGGDGGGKSSGGGVH